MSKLDLPPRLGERTLFSKLTANAYLNHAGISPPSDAVLEATRRVLDDYASLGSAAFLTWLAQRERLRSKLAEFVGAKSHEIGFVQNTTSGVLAVALCLPWRSRDRVVIHRGEFPANVTPWQRAAALFDLELEFLPAWHDAATGLERLEHALKGGVRLVALSAVQFQTGIRLPLREIGDLCHRFGAEVFVDAVQACGVVPIHVENDRIDYLSCGGQKWMMGIEGAGFLYIHRDKKMRPYFAGWLSHEDPAVFLFEDQQLRYDRPIRDRADFVELGTCAATALAALEASLDIIVALGGEAVFSHVNTYLDLLEAELVQREMTSLRPADSRARAGILSVCAPPGSTVGELAAILGEQHIVCGTPDGMLRFSPHWANSLDEVPVIARALDRALGRTA